MLQRRDRIISKVKYCGVKKYVNMTMKFGIECLKSVKEAMELDKKNGNTLWYDAITKEMHSVQVTFDIREKGYTPSPGHQFIKCVI